MSKYSVLVLSVCQGSLMRQEGTPHFTDLELGPEKPFVQGPPAGVSDPRVQHTGHRTVSAHVHHIGVNEVF